MRHGGKIRTVDRLTTFEAGGLRYIAEDRCAISADEDSGHRAGEERNEQGPEFKLM